jgi:5'-nucleotidase
MRVLLTNDDGIESPGVHTLASAVHAAGHDVLVVAPSGQCSGTAAAIGRLHRAGPLACTAVEWPDLPGIPVFALDTTPAAAVYAGVLGALGSAPDVVMAGINPGANTGHLVLHSGTVGAALTAQVLGIPGLAVSQAWGETQSWSTAAAIAVAALAWVAGEWDGRPPVLNLNVPNLALDEVRGIRDAVLTHFDEHWTAELRAGEIVLSYKGRGETPDPDTDVALLREGYATVTPLAGILPATRRPKTSPAAVVTAALGNPHH